MLTIKVEEIFENVDFQSNPLTVQDVASMYCSFFFPFAYVISSYTFCFLILTINVELNALHILGSAS